MIHFHDKNAPGGCDIFNHESVNFPEQKATAEEQGTEEVSDRVVDMVVDLAVMQETDLLKTWNDENHDQ